VGILFLALGFSVFVMLVSIYQTLKKMVLKLVYKCKVRKAKKGPSAEDVVDFEDTMRAPIARKKSEMLEEIAEEDEEEEEEEEGVVKDVSFETDNEVSARVDIRPVIIRVGTVPLPRIEIEDVESLQEEKK
jgi:hypothetical protein